ncbi:unnamed protein product [Echinostoma caproni]|uniref:Uncharacterized protein n=1 Tax=Echinostoma caproni TaxID=27848 RepID=A0A183A7H3_9TREM|nr:unnamed protein product [Echinostoma caproni]
MKSCFRSNCSPYQREPALTTFVPNTYPPTKSVQCTPDELTHPRSKVSTDSDPQESGDTTESDETGDHCGHAVGTCERVRTGERSSDFKNLSHRLNTTQSTDQRRSGQLDLENAHAKCHNSNTFQRISNTTDRPSPGNQGYCELITTDGRGSAPPTFVTDAMRVPLGSSDYPAKKRNDEN